MSQSQEGLKYNKSHSAIKRIMSEIQEMKRNPSSDFIAHPLDDNLFEWHFTVRGPRDTAFEGGVYHGRIILPAEYPYKPPDLMLLTPNGRFETNKKICLSISSHHPESWMPAWGIRTVLIALIGFFPTPAQGIGAIEYPDNMRQQFAKKSLDYTCSTCGCHNRTALPAVTEQNNNENNVEQNNNNVDNEQPSPAVLSNQQETDSVNTNEQVNAAVRDNVNTSETTPVPTVSPSEITRRTSNTSVQQRRPSNAPRKLSTAAPSSAFEPGALLLNMLIFAIAVLIGIIMFNKIADRFKL